MSSKLISGSDEYYYWVDAIDDVYEMEEGERRAKAVKKLRSRILSKYGPDDEEAMYLINHKLKHL